MKIVKYIFLLLLLAAVALTVFIATQDGKYNIVREQYIKAPKNVLYNFVNDYRNWESVALFPETDTTTVYTFSENAGKTQLTWKSADTEGKLYTIKTVGNDSIIQKAHNNGLDSDIFWKFKDTLNGTKVTVMVKGRLSFIEKAYSVLNGDIKNQTETGLQNSLDNLNDYLVNELSTYTIDVKGMVKKNAVFYLGHTDSVTVEGLNRKIFNLLPKLLNFVKENKIATNGAPFILYKKHDSIKGFTKFAVCVPIKEEIFTSPGSEFEGGKLESFNALKTTLKGDYSHLKEAWNAAYAHVRKNNLPENTFGSYIEVYSTGMQQTKKPSQWVTDIYIPIGKPAPVLNEAGQSINNTAGSTAKTTAPPAYPINRPRPSSENVNMPENRETL
jgi:predicted transcriptional regulator YdeE